MDTKTNKNTQGNFLPDNFSLLVLKSIAEEKQRRIEKKDYVINIIMYAVIIITTITPFIIYSRSIISYISDIFATTSQTFNNTFSSLDTINVLFIIIIVNLFLLVSAYTLLIRKFGNKNYL